jgi:hypothetical protein
MSGPASKTTRIVVTRWPDAVKLVNYGKGFDCYVADNGNRYTHVSRFVLWLLTRLGGLGKSVGLSVQFYLYSFNFLNGDLGI